MQDKIKAISERAEKDFLSAKNLQDLYQAKLAYTGKKGELSLLMKSLKDLSPEEKPQAGKLLNEIQDHLENIYSKREQELQTQTISEEISKDDVDMSLPGTTAHQGSLHPTSMVIRRIVEIFSSLGWSIQTGPFVETDWYNFTSLNIPPFHPSRDLQDTFYIDEDFVLRTHTSPVQIRTLESTSPPLAILAPGAVFRSDSDVSHSPMFHQVEGLFVDKQVSMPDLRGVLAYFLQEFFEKKVDIRFRPSYFPFTEPSAEYDISCFFCSNKGCSICKKSGWIEIGGCGLVHPNVFKSAKLKKEWQGYAFGLGVERLAMLLYGIPDIRLFF